MKRILAISIGLMLVFGVVEIASGAGKEPQGKQRAGQEVSPTKPDLPEEASEKAKVKVEKIWERKFDEEIKDVAFGEGEITVEEARNMGMKGLEKERPRKKIKVRYPKIAVTKKAIKFLDPKGKVKKQISLGEITPKGWERKVKISKQGIGVLSHIFRYKEDRPSEAEFTMIDKNGNILYKIDISKVGYNMPYISPSNYIVGTGDITGDYFGYLPSVWNHRGLVKVLFKWEEMKIVEWGGAEFSLNSCAFNGDGKLFATTIYKRIWNQNDKKFKEEHWLILFNENGEEIWRRDLSPYKIRDIGVSDNGEFIVVRTSRRIYEETGETKIIKDKRGKERIAKRRKLKEAENYLLLFDKNGILLWKKNIPSGELNSIFSTDEKKLFAIIGRARYLFNVSTGDLVWEHTDEVGYGLPITSINSAPDFSLFVVASRSQGRGNFYLFNGDGKKIWFKQFAVEPLAFGRPSLPKVTVASIGRRITLVTETRIMQYQLGLRE